MMKSLKLNSRLVLLGVVMFALLISLWQTRIAFRNTTAPPNATEAATAASTTAGGFANSLAITLFLGVIVFAQTVHVLRANQSPAEPGADVKLFANQAWVAGLATAFVIILGTIVFVDPRGLFGTNVYEPRLLLVRGEKIDSYSKLTETPDVVVLGTSRAFTVLPEFFEQDLGYSAFNMSVEGARMEDYVMQTEYILEQNPDNPPKVLMIEITPPLLESPDAVAQRAPLKLIPYMETKTAKMAIEYRVEGLLDLTQFNEAIYSLRYYASNSEVPESWTFAPDGGGIRQPISNLEPRVKRVAEQQPIRNCPGAKLNEQGSKHLEQVVKMAEEHRMSVVFYVAPLHPIYFEQRMEGNQAYLRCEKAIHTYMDELTRRYPFVFFLYYARLEDIQGAADETGYYDYQHMTPLNNHYLLTAAADTVQQAYDLTVQKRAQDS